MLLNGYDTTIGNRYKKIDNVEQSIKTLQLTDSLPSTNKEGVYYLDRTIDKNMSVLCYPLTFKSLTNQWCTVVDLRPFLNTTNKIINLPEYKLAKLTAGIQQDFASGNTTPVYLHRGFCSLVIGRAIAMRLKMKSNLDPLEELTAAAIISYYYLYQTQQDIENHRIIVLNILKSARSLDSVTYETIMDNLGTMKDLNDLLNELKNYPSLFKLNNLTLVDFLTIVNSLSLFSLGKQVPGAMLEFPPLLEAFIYTTLTNTHYNKTTLGLVLNNKDLKLQSESFINYINSNYQNYLLAV